MSKKAGGILVRPRRYSRDYMERKNSDLDEETSFNQFAEKIFNEHCGANRLLEMPNIINALKSKM